MLDVNKQHTEFGIDPKYKVSMTQEDIEKGKDTIIEAAITRLLSETEKEQKFDRLFNIQNLVN